MSSEPPSNRGTARVVLAPVALLGLATILLAAPWRFISPVPAATAVPGWVIDAATVRRPTLRPEHSLAGFTYRCRECHNLFPSPPETTRTLTRHSEIVLKHGINTRCFNCHHRTNRDAYVDDFGGEIPFDQPQLLCAKCHGPVYRDWQHGAHGRSNGYWDTSRGAMTRRKCVGCHDPHQPPFPPMKPAPPPNTMRMGPQGLAGHGTGDNPLRRSGSGEAH